MSFSHILNKADPKNVGYMQEQIARLDPTKRWSFKVEEYAKTRTEEQNAISHAWYAQLAKELKDDTALAYKCFCKLHMGVPILRTEDEEFRKVYDLAVKPLEYAKKLEIMKYFPVTSIMKTKQLSQYLEAMQLHFASQVKLEFPAPQEERT